MVFPVLINGEWVEADSTDTFHAYNPATGEGLTETYPVSRFSDCERILSAAALAADELQRIEPSRIAEFLRGYADRIESNREVLAKIAAEETGLPESPRLRDVELPRTINQLRQAATAAETHSWSLPTIDSANNIRSVHAAIGPVLVIGPNNFPFAFNGVSGGDFAAAIAAGNPVIAKAHPAHPATCRMLAELALDAVIATGLPKATVQMLYRTTHDDGLKMIRDPRLAAVGFTGSRNAGLAIKAACDELGKPVYLEMSSINPVVILPGAIAERSDSIVSEFCTSCTMGAGQFCTNPGFMILIDDEKSRTFVSEVARLLGESKPGTLLTEGVLKSLAVSVQMMVDAGSQLLTGGKRADRAGFAFENTALLTSGNDFLNDPFAFQTEMFGAATLFVMAADVDQAERIIATLEGNLTGTFYVANDGMDQSTLDRLQPRLRQRVGRLIFNRMPTGVAVSPAMNHGGPFPSTGHPGFTSVGMPASIRRFSMLQCFDAVSEDALPPILLNANAFNAWRFVDGDWSQQDVIVGAKG
ncbi:MAG: aldehyde dehydrogenase (NADP(+)) [Pirellulaceae bacterium]